MVKHRTYSIEFKRQVAQEYIAGETLHALAKRHWVNSHWAGGTTSVRAQVSTEVPDGWTFELYPPPPKPEMLYVGLRWLWT